MVYTEVKERNGKKYYYRVLSIRKGKKISKKRIYLGRDLNKKELLGKEKIADVEFNLIKNNKFDKIKEKIVEILKKNKIKRAGLFGSYARGDYNKNSDIDILIEPRKGMGFGFVGIQIELEESLGKKIDLVSYNGLSPYLKESILKEEVKII